MNIQIETESYNERRYGKPWIAKVDFSDNANSGYFSNLFPTGNFAWGNWVGDPGSTGLLILDAEPGDVVARGQKDNRGRRENSAPRWAIVNEAGELVSCTRVEAYTHATRPFAVVP